MLYTIDNIIHFFRSSIVDIRTSIAYFYTFGPFSLVFGSNPSLSLHPLTLGEVHPSHTRPSSRHNTHPHCALCGNHHYTRLCPTLPDVIRLPNGLIGLTHQDSVIALCGEAPSASFPLLAGRWVVEREDEVERKVAKYFYLFCPLAPSKVVTYFSFSMYFTLGFIAVM